MHKRNYGPINHAIFTYLRSEQLVICCTSIPPILYPSEKATKQLMSALRDGCTVGGSQGMASGNIEGEHYDNLAREDDCGRAQEEAYSVEEMDAIRESAEEKLQLDG
ncbi:hypothetical protein QAD02_024403 [Eretmocerus hayati]|uniref:Uncharacterized protein n=1 Tax=Eretmocerus hayati TaxID=131215 RepID=A0ACC2PZN9_9HYME|nr:hypothetical protein QAD02_024403 [Eretmocerus hayati]